VVVVVVVQADTASARAAAGPSSRGRGNVSHGKGVCPRVGRSRDDVPYTLNTVRMVFETFKIVLFRKAAGYRIIDRKFSNWLVRGQAGPAGRR